MKRILLLALFVSLFSLSSFAADDLDTSLSFYRTEVSKYEFAWKHLEEKRIAIEHRVGTFPNPVPTARKKDYSALLAEQEIVLTSCTTAQARLDNFKETLKRCEEIKKGKQQYTQAVYNDIFPPGEISNPYVFPGWGVYAYDPEVEQSKSYDADSSGDYSLFGKDSFLGSGFSNKTVFVHGYTKKNGTYVHSYNRRPPSR